MDDGLARRSITVILRSLLPLAKDLNRIETLLVLAAVVIAFALPRVGSKWFHTAERRLGRLAARRWQAVVLVGVLAILARAALLPLLPIPQPAVHDEFSYLLAADTFAHGRLTNPTHPMWIHFETFHITQKPTYMSKYPPAQGLMLAAGEVVTGNAFWGVLFSVGLMCGAICWMLQGWMPPGWALLGAGLALFRLAIFSNWSNGYMGGTVAGIGGALVVGALPRLMRRPQVRTALLTGVGLAILANSRPYEGSFLGLATAVALLVWLWGKKGPSLGVALRRVVLPLLMVLIATGCAMGYYCWRVTGSPFRFPYLVYTKIYDPVPFFPWQALKPLPDYHHVVMRAGYLGWVDRYRFVREHPFQVAVGRARYVASFFFGPLLVMPAVVLLLAGRWSFFCSFTKRGKARLLLLLCVVPLLGIALPVYFSPRYVGPVTGVLYAMALLAMRHLRWWRWRGQPVGRQIVRAIPVLAVAMLALQANCLALKSWCAHGFPVACGSAPVRGFGRREILSQLDRYPGGQLVLLRYNANHDPGFEWVYNDADIDAAKVVWARDMGPGANEELIRYFKDRRIWLLEADDSPPKLLPYPPTSSQQQNLENNEIR